MSNDSGFVYFWKKRIKLNVNNKCIKGAQVGQRVLHECFGIDISFKIDGKKYTYEDQRPNLIRKDL